MRSSYLFIIPVIFICSSCTQPGNNNNNEEKAPNTKLSLQVTVHSKGAIQQMMQEGDISAKADLKPFSDSSYFYAIGALENLKGEIQILNGRAYNSFVQDTSVVIDTSFAQQAALLVYSFVPQWERHEIPDSVTTYSKLENYIHAMAQQKHLDTDQAFPFLLRGTAQTVQWHVINWATGDTVHTHHKHKTSGLTGTLHNRDVQLLGFYSTSHQGVFTHHKRRSHIHVITDSIAGHVDNLRLSKGMTLHLPVH